MEDALKAGEETKARMGVKSIEELRKLSADRIVGELSAHHHLTVDGYVLAETPWESYEKGSYNEEARLHGFNGQESEAFILFEQANQNNYEGKIRKLFSGEGAEQVLALYPAANDAEAKRNWADIYSAFFFTYGHAVWERQAAGMPTYEYLFTRKNGSLGDWHSGEQVYFYGNIPEKSDLYNETDRKLSETMQRYFVNFIRTGDPNDEGLPEWPANTGAENQLLVLDEDIRLETDPFSKLYPVLDSE
jgi:para-nitrobenzyl esterase